MDALIANVASNDPKYRQLSETDSLQKVSDLRYKILNGLKKLYVPDNQTVKNLLLMTVHDLPYAGHPGILKTTELMTRQYYSIGMHADIVALCVADEDARGGGGGLRSVGWEAPKERSLRTWRK